MCRNFSRVSRICCTVACNTVDNTDILGVLCETTCGIISTVTGHDYHIISYRIVKFKKYI